MPTRSEGKKKKQLQFILLADIPSRDYFLKGVYMTKKNILITGRPGVGKTTLLQKVCTELESFRPAGFVTREIREKGQRQGFELFSLDGRRQILAHNRINGQGRVGKYGVNVRGFDAFLDSLDLQSAETGFFAVDEIGKMECLSTRFVHIVRQILESNRPFLATIAVKGSGFIKEVKDRDDVELLSLNEKNREHMAGELAELIRRLKGRAVG